MKTIKQVSKLSGASVRTLQYYDNIHLLTPSRTESSYRLYSDEDIAKLQQILFLKELGFSLKAIRELINHPGFDHRLVFHKQKEILCAQRQQVGRVIRVLERLENGASLDDCAADIKSISKESKNMKKSLTAFIVLALLLAGAFGVYQIVQQSQPDSDVPATVSMDIININQFPIFSSAARDIKVKSVDATSLPENSPLLDQIVLPIDLQEDITIQGFYSRDNEIEYGKLENYAIMAGDYTRYVCIGFSTERMPIHELYTPEGEKSLINGHEVMIGQHIGPIVNLGDTIVQTTNYYIDFTANGMNYSIETHGFTETEMIALIKSLL